MWGVCKADKVGLNGGNPSTSCLCTLQSSYITHGLAPTGFIDLQTSFEILVKSTKFLKNGV